MSTNKFTDEFKRDAVAQVVDRGYPVREVAERLGVSTKSIYTWQRLFSRPAKVVQEVDAQADEIRRLKRDLARVTSGTSKKRRPHTLPGNPGEVCIHSREPAGFCRAGDVPDAAGSSEWVLCMAP